MKVFSISQRIYYKDLEPEAESILKKDLELYNCMLHKAFKICFDRAYKDVTYSETDQRTECTLLCSLCDQSKRHGICRLNKINNQNQKFMISYWMIDT